LRLSFQITEERIARLDEESAFRSLATSTLRNETARQEAIASGEQRREQIRQVLRDMAGDDPVKVYLDREGFLTALRSHSNQRGLRLSAPETKAIVSAVGERDESAEICRDRAGNLEPDPDLRDTENVPLKETVDAYVRREVLPHVPGAWVDHSKTKVGYEIPFNRHFYVYEPPRPLGEIEAEIKGLEREIVNLLSEVTA
jgi:type I restriction enzyme M protein